MGSYPSDVRKVRPLLDALEGSRKQVYYFALDLSEQSLERAMESLSRRYTFVHCSGLWGRFEDARTWSKGIQSPKCFLSLGSIFGNAPFEEAVTGLRKWASLMQPTDRMLLAMDAHTDRDIIWNSYHDSEGHYERFVRNGLTRTNELLGRQWYQDADWEVCGRLQDKPVMHQTFFKATREIDCLPLKMHFSAGDEITCGGAYKYGPAVMNEMFVEAGFRRIDQWKAPSSPICGWHIFYSFEELTR